MNKVMFDNEQKYKRNFRVNGKVREEYPEQWERATGNNILEGNAFPAKCD